MLTKSFTVFSIFFLGNLVSCQQYVSISVPTQVNYPTDKLKFRCRPTNVPTTAGITSIELSKNSSSGFNVIVRVYFQITGTTVDNSVTWTSGDFQNRATIIGLKVVPTNEANLEFDINADKVRCTDAGTYQCAIDGKLENGEGFDDTASNSINMQVQADSIQQIQVQPNQPDFVYNPNTIVRLFCTGSVGNPAGELRWCYRKSSDFSQDFLGYPYEADIDKGSPMLQGCQYVRTSVLTYNVTSGYDHVDFRCETGGTSTVCAHQSAIASNYTIKLFTTTSNSAGQGGEETASGGVIAGAVIGSFVGVVLIIIIVYFVAFRKKNEGETYRTKEENGTGTAPIDNSVYSLPNKDRNGRDRNSPRDKKHYENRGLDEPHTRGYNQDPRGRSNPAMERSFDDVRGGHNMMPSSGPVMGSNASFGSAV